jgi:hypothetical protein
MACVDKNKMTRPAPEVPCVRARVDTEDAVETDDSDNMPVEPVVDGDEWPADEAGYGYGV